ncbi:MAG TPA: Wzz/FepE/Etk N-terminal domain-containing protein [Ohtaekwangia sp.]|nr:Wzz/FepE/Etk N-terminal domain-containing protein [Ohtaekwangia sp.]
MDLLLLAKVLWRKKWILISIPLVAAIAAFIFTMDTVDMYRASSQIATGFTQNDVVSITDEKFNIRDADVKFNNLLSTMRTAIPMNLVAFRLLLHDLESETPFRKPQNFYPAPEETETVVKFLKEKIANFSPLSTSDEHYNLVRKFLTAYRYSYPHVREAINISRVQNTDNVIVEFISDDPNVSALGANAYVDEFIKYYNSLKSERTGQSVEFLKALMDQKKTAYDEKTETQKIFKASNGLVDINRDSEAKLTQIQELERSRSDARSRIQKLELTIQRLNDDIRSAGSGGQQTVNNQQIIELRERIARMNERYITSGSSNRALADSLASMREQLRIQMERNTMVTPSADASRLPDLQSRLKDAEIDLKVERTNLAALEDKIGSLKYAVSGFASKEAALEAIQKEVELAQQEYLEAVNKYNEAQNRMISSTTLRKVIAAAPPPYPESSKRYLVIGAAGFSSFAICLFVIIGLELIDVSIKTPEKFKRIVGLPLNGMLNKIDSRNFNVRSYFNQTTNNEETEMYKSMLRKFRHEVESSAGSKVLLFTSPKRKDGKTFLIFSLAYVLSLINKRVLIIDTNFKNNSLSQLLVKPNSEIKVLEGRRVNLLIGSGKEAKEAVDGEAESESTYELINPTKYKNIFIVGNAGGGSESPAEILSGRDFKNLIEVLKESFDYILMEGAALNDFSDTKELVTFSDRVYAVFSADTTIKQLDRESIGYFRSLGKRFGGAILNRVNTKDLKL